MCWYDGEGKSQKGEEGGKDRPRFAVHELKYSEFQSWSEVNVKYLSEGEKKKKIGGNFKLTLFVYL